MTQMRGMGFISMPRDASGLASLFEGFAHEWEQGNLP
jgi:hypothetical protein